MISTTPLIQPKVRLTLDRPRPKPKPIERNPVLNLYQPEPAPSTLNALKPMHLYDINCAMPFHILETDAIRLEPLIVSDRPRGDCCWLMASAAVKAPRWRALAAC